MILNFDEKITFNNTEKNPCEGQAMLCINDFLLENTDNDNIVFYPVDTNTPGHADFHIGIEKRHNDKLTVKSIQLECKSAKYQYYNSKKEKYCYDGSLMFNENQINPNANKLFVLVLKTDKQIDSIKIGYFNVKQAIDKNIITPKGEDYRYRFNKEKSQMIRQNIFLNPNNGNKEEMQVLVTYTAKEIKDLVDFYNSRNAVERKEYIKELSILDLIRYEKVDNYNEIGYNELKGMIKND